MKEIWVITHTFADQHVHYLVDYPNFGYGVEWSSDLLKAMCFPSKMLAEMTLFGVWFDPNDLTCNFVTDEDGWFDYDEYRQSFIAELEPIVKVCKVELDMYSHEKNLVPDLGD